MLRLRSEGYTHVIMQSSNIIDGVEMESLRRDMESVQPFFKETVSALPLLYSVEDAEKVVEILNNRLTDTQNKKHPLRKVMHSYLSVMAPILPVPPFTARWTIC